MSSDNTLLNTVKEWVHIDNEIKVLQNEIKKRKKNKKKINEELLNIMKNNEIEQLNIPDGELQYKKYKTKAPLSKKHLIKSIATYFQHKNPDLTKELSSFIMDTREIKETENIKRKIKNK
tara:strand:+ start:135 stop:494 length:360 start_codon:yes stop_codon:yes gene_type:complete